jgi:hypothetical protein
VAKDDAAWANVDENGGVWVFSSAIQSVNDTKRIITVQLVNQRVASS